MWAYIMNDTEMPRPWHVRPAMTMGTAVVSGCVSAMTEAMVPDSMMGKMGRIHVGIMVVRAKLWAAKT